MKPRALLIALLLTGGGVQAQQEAPAGALLDSVPSVSGREDAHASPQRIAALKASVRHVLALSEADLVALVPKRSRGIRWTTCPQCRKRSRGANWNWEPARPHEVTCADCNTVFPNEQYPEVHMLEVPAPGGVHRFPFHEEAARSNGAPAKAIRRFFGVAADYRAKNYLVGRTLELATLYAATRETDYAHRACLILSEFARVFPGWPAVFDGEWMDSPVRFVAFDNLTPESLHHNDRSARWEFWSVMDVSTELLTAYDRLRDWPAWKTPEGKAAAQVIERDLFGEQIKHILRFDEGPVGNMAITVKWPSLLWAARVLRQPELFHQTVRRVEHFLDTSFLYDGGWWETSPSYAQQIVTSGLARLPQVADGYSDPPGYSDPTSGKRFDNLNLRRLPAFERAERVLTETRLPDGRLLPLNDTWPTAHSVAGRRTEMKSALFPAFGVAVLGTGRGAAQTCAWLNFTAGVSHKHADALSIGFYSGGAERLPDLGYTHSRYRAWAVSTMAHNTVVVNGRESQHDASYHGNRMESFVSDGRLFNIVAVKSLSAYPGVVHEYKRTLALIGTDADDAYLIDIFDVGGGEQHDYLLHGNADADSVATLSGSEVESFTGSLLNPGARFTVPLHQSESAGGASSAYGFVRNLRRSVSEGGAATLTFAEAGRDMGLRSHFLADKGDELFLGQAPSIRRIGGTHLREDESKLDEFQAPFFCWRRRGEALVSQFVALHQCLPTRVPIGSVTRTFMADGTLVLRINRGKGDADYFLKSAAGRKATNQERIPEGLLCFQGEHGWLRIKGGRVSEARLVGRGEITLGDFELRQPAGHFAGAVRSVGQALEFGVGAYFDVPERLPLDAKFSALVLSFSDGTQRAFNVTGVNRPGGAAGTRIHVGERPGFNVSGDGVNIDSYPPRQIKGRQISYSLSTWTSFEATKQ